MVNEVKKVVGEVGYPYVAPGCDGHRVLAVHPVTVAGSKEVTESEVLEKKR